MKTVYADSLIALNAALDYLLLLAAGKLCALPLRRWRLGLGALWGGVYALLALLFPSFFGLVTVKLLSGALSVLLAYGCQRQTMRAVAAFYAVSAALAGLIYAVSRLSGQAADGVPYPVSLRTLLLAFALGYAVLTLAFRHWGRRAERRIEAVTLWLGARQVRLSALVDTGNELIDPVTGRGALVAEAEALAPLLDDPAPLRAPEPLEALEGLRRQGLACRLLPCRAVTGGTGLLLCFVPTRIEVAGRRRDDLLVAVSPQRFCADGAYRAILSQTQAE